MDTNIISVKLSIGSLFILKDRITVLVYLLWYVPFVVDHVIHQILDPLSDFCTAELSIIEVGTNIQVDVIHQQLGPQQRVVNR